MGKNSKQSGQAIIEYVMLLAIILSIGYVLQYGMRKSRDKFWKKIICEVSAICPRCKAPPSAEETLKSGGPCTNTQ